MAQINSKADVKRVLKNVFDELEAVRQYVNKNDYDVINKGFSFSCDGSLLDEDPDALATIRCCNPIMLAAVVSENIRCLRENPLGEILVKAAVAYADDPSIHKAFASNDEAAKQKHVEAFAEQLKQKFGKQRPTPLHICEE